MLLYGDLHVYRKMVWENGLNDFLYGLLFFFSFYLFDPLVIFNSFQFNGHFGYAYSTHQEYYDDIEYTTVLLLNMVLIK